MALTRAAAVLTDKHRRDQVRLAITADSEARRAWDLLDMNNLDGTQALFEYALSATLNKWFNLGVMTALDYLPKYREASIGERRSVDIRVPDFSRYRVRKKLGWLGATGIKWHLARGESEQDAWRNARSIFLGQFHEAVLTGGRETIREWARRDPRAIGWRRVSDGDPCAFCAMLVTRGPVYTSEQRALSRESDGTKYHAHCGCTVEVVYGDWKPTGLEQHWIDEYYRAAEKVPEGKRTWDNVLPLMRENGAFRDSPAVRSPEAWLKRQAQKEAGRPKRVTMPRVVHPDFDDARRARMESAKSKGLQEAFIEKMEDHIGDEQHQSKEHWPSIAFYPSRAIIRHVLHGEPDNIRRGGHLHGTGRLNKTEFPEGWDEKKVMDAAAEVIRAPQWWNPAKAPNGLSYYVAVIDGVQVEVAAYQYEGKLVIDQIYPKGGRGVIRNVVDGTIEVKTIDLSKRYQRWRKS